MCTRRWLTPFDTGRSIRITKTIKSCFHSLWLLEVLASHAPSTPSLTLRLSPPRSLQHDLVRDPHRSVRPRVSSLARARARRRGVRARGRQLNLIGNRHHVLDRRGRLLTTGRVHLGEER